MMLRDKRKQETRKSLIDVATEMFVTEGYDGVAAQALCERAGVTRGALYHHFPGGKPDLFKAVFGEVQDTLRLAVREAGEAESEARLTAYLLGASETVYRRIVWEEGPHVLGWNLWRRAERDQWMNVIAEGLVAANVDKNKSLIIGAIVFGAAGEVVMSIADADNRHAAVREASDLIRVMIQAAYAASK